MERWCEEGGRGGLNERARHSLPRGTLCFECASLAVAAEFTAFLMTLRRKNLAPHGPLVTTYGLMLGTGFVISTIDHSMHGWCVPATAHLK